MKKLSSDIPSLSKPSESRTIDITVTTQLEIGARMHTGAAVESKM